MRIAMVAPLIESVPPPQYGGTERVVSVLAEELVRRGHDVTLFASGDSHTRAHLWSCCPRGLRLDSQVHDYLPHSLHELGEVYRHSDEFDLIHSHVDWTAFPFADLVQTPTVSTVHGRLDDDIARAPYELFPGQPLVSISNAQRRPLPEANWLATVYNGIDLSNYRFRPDPGDYLVFLGRISPEKRPDRAIAIACEVGMRLVIAAKVDPIADSDYYEQEIAPLIRDCPQVDYIGEVDEREKDALLGGAYAYLFPIDWPEPFGLTMVEAMATGTPVVAWRAGSVPEVVVDGVTGHICDSLEEMIAAVRRVGAIDRADCRAHVERERDRVADDTPRVARCARDRAPARSDRGRRAGPRHARGVGGAGQRTVAAGPAYTRARGVAHRSRLTHRRNRELGRTANRGSSREARAERGWALALALGGEAWAAGGPVANDRRGLELRRRRRGRRRGTGAQPRPTRR